MFFFSLSLVLLKLAVTVLFDAPSRSQAVLPVLAFEQQKQTHPVQIKRISACFGLILPILVKDVRSVKSVFASGLQAAPPLRP